LKLLNFICFIYFVCFFFVFMSFVFCLYVFCLYVFCLYVFCLYVFFLCLLSLCLLSLCLLSLCLLSLCLLLVFYCFFTFDRPSGHLVVVAWTGLSFIWQSCTKIRGLCNFWYSELMNLWSGSEALLHFLLKQSR
jgi:hypothetical protein